MLFQGKNSDDIQKANLEKKTAIFFGFQNCSPIEDDISLVEKIHDLGCRYIILSDFKLTAYNPLFVDTINSFISIFSQSCIDCLVCLQSSIQLFLSG